MISSKTLGVARKNKYTLAIKIGIAAASTVRCEKLYHFARKDAPFMKSGRHVESCALAKRLTYAAWKGRK
jgi:hypothetical protein